MIQGFTKINLFLIRQEGRIFVNKIIQFKNKKTKKKILIKTYYLNK